MAGSGDCASGAGMSGSDRTSARDRGSGRGDTRRPSITYSGIRGRLAPGPGGPMRWFFSAIWLVYLIQPVSGLFGQHHSAAWIAGGLAITVAFCITYVAVVGTWDRAPRRAIWGLGVIFALAVLACVVYGSDWLALWIYVSAATGFAFPGRRPAIWAILVVSACYAALGWLTHANAGDFLITLLPVVLIGLAMIGFRMQIMLTRELSQARETVAKLAANEERLRLARDMHDLTGQSLSLVTLKSDLARKMLSRLPQTSERDAALREVDDIGQVSRQTLRDIREAVSGYRRPTLAIEIITARTALESAGIHLDDNPGLTLRSGSFDADAEAALAWCLREAVTNVIRHSGAKNCRVKLTLRDGEASLEVSDDGRGLSGRADRADADGPEPAVMDAAGSGLRGMSERLAAMGGRLSLGTSAAGGRGFRLIATVPDHSAPPPGDHHDGAATPVATAAVADASDPPPANIWVRTA
jgi:two-component system, NarL family, sensor histidine kinase DesK